jgi:hypothetical protein
VYVQSKRVLSLDESTANASSTTTTTTTTASGGGARMPEAGVARWPAATLRRVPLTQAQKRAVRSHVCFRFLTSFSLLDRRCCRFLVFTEICCSCHNIINYWHKQCNSPQQ